MRTKLLALLCALLACVSVQPAQAANLLVNGDFEQITVNRSSIFDSAPNSRPWGPNGPSDNIQQTVVGWESIGFNFVMRPGDVDTIGAVSPYAGANLILWGPGNGVANGLTGSPTGGNFIAADGAFRNGPISQTVSNLQIGESYTVKFWWAAGQQKNFLGATTDRWDVCFGTCDFQVNNAPDGYGMFLNGTVKSSSTVALPDKGFSPWKEESMTFVATAQTQKLSLLAYGTPLGQPPFALIDGISLEGGIVPPVAVPEPSTWAMMLIGFFAVGATLRGRRSIHVPRSARQQII
ncbi:PEPxxWA-CTERM sorting domain-containing protein [Sphingomonas sp. SRS2]|uniref:PEPxxWA-CTERM sorting domain-containing protein n=1 Tax=Sphingomonas sp. SRS2 TaxID=133190 RepID=UPI0006184B60|nr:PEPxxWA-CTERM sorting domain-containing protein [Sphingomonas sp. SRS2]KKC26112.1 hypothetical protein WP12_10615 [Sphingomonas sp. SRS2]